MNWLHYLLEANIYLAVFYACYCLFLNKETYYTLNRAYLLLSCIVSFILPVMQIGALKSVEKVPEITLASHTGPAHTMMAAGSLTVQPNTVYHITWDNVLWGVYIIGISVLALLLVIKLFKLVNLTTSGKRLIDNKYKLIDIEEADTAFSFFNYLFIGTKISGSDIIIRHELVHIRQKHSFDIVFIEVIKIINWFNPVIYLLQISLKTVHEYIADEQTAAHETDALAYSSFLVNNAYGLNGPSVTHSFFNDNLLKKRIIMLNQKRSGNLARLKYLVAAPICAGMLCASTFAFSKNYGWIKIPLETKSVSVGKVTADPKRAINDYLDKNLGYPQNALSNNIPGNVTCLINIDDSHHINGINVTESTSPEFYKQVFNCLNNCKKIIPVKAGTYAVYIQFVLQGPNTFYADAGKQKGQPYPCAINLVQLGYSKTLKAGKQNLVL